MTSKDVSSWYAVRFRVPPPEFRKVSLNECIKVCDEECTQELIKKLKSFGVADFEIQIFRPEKMSWFVDYRRGIILNDQNKSYVKILFEKEHDATFFVLSNKLEYIT